MRRALTWRPGAGAVAAIVVGVVFVLWAIVKAVPFLDTQTAAVFATPTSQPETQLALKGKGGRMCTTGVEFGPDARYAQITVRSKYDVGPVAVEARAGGYSAEATRPSGGPLNGVLTLPIRPAGREVRGGKLCVVNEGRHSLTVFGVAPGRSTVGGATTTIDGKPSPAQMSLTLLTKPSASLGSRLGAIFDHVAAFRPVAAWEVWILALLVGLGAPVAIAVALMRAIAEDEPAATPPAPPPGPEPAPAAE